MTLGASCDWNEELANTFAHERPRGHFLWSFVGNQFSAGALYERTEIRSLRSLLLDPKLSPLRQLSTFSGIHLHLGYHIHDCENHKSSIGATSPENLSIGAPHSIHS